MTATLTDVGATVNRAPGRWGTMKAANTFARGGVPDYVSPTDAQLERLLAEAEWIRRLAQALVGDEGDDLAQDAWVATLRRPPDPQRAPRPWLKQVLLNLRATRARAFTRRLGREAASLEDAGGAADPESLAARMQLQARLANLVVALPEPFRATVVARYYEGQTASAIAAATGVPAGTVRWRLKHALGLLRARLDEESGARQWRLALLALGAGREPGPGAPALLIGGVAVKKAGVVIALLVVAALLALGTRYRRHEGGMPPAAGGGASGRGERPGVAGAGAGTGEDARAPARPLPAWFAQKGAPYRRVAGTVVLAGQPVSGATVTLASVLTEAGYLPVRTATTGADGRFDLGLQAPARFTVSAAAAGRTTAMVEVEVADPRARPAPDALVLELLPCDHSLTGIVRDASGGVVRGARVRRSRHGWALGPGVVAGADGRYVLCTHEGTERIVVTAPGYGALTVYTRERGHAVRDFVLVPEALVFGRVVRAVDGTPVPLAHVYVQPAERPGKREISRHVLSDRDGRFRIDQVPPGKHRVGAAGDGVAATRWAEVQVAPGELATGITIELGAGVDVTGTVTVAGGPVAGATVALYARDTAASPRAVVTQADGRFVMQGVAPGALRLDVEGYRVLSPTSVTVDAQPVTVAVEVVALGGIRGRVTRNGRPVGDAEVTAAGGQRYSHHARSGGDGRYEIAGLDAATYEVSAMSERLGAFVARAPRVAHTEGAVEEVDLELDADGTLAGQVLDATGRPLTAVHVRWTREDRQDEGEGMTDADGRFVATMLAGEGRYRAEVRPSRNAAVTLAPAAPFPVVFVPGPDSHVTDVVLRVDPHTDSITGRTVMTGGAPAPDVRLVAVPVRMKTVEAFAECVEFPTAYAAADGSFELRGLSAGRYLVQATAPSGATVTARDVAAGRRDLVVELPATGTLEIALRGFTSSPTVFARPEGSVRRLLAAARGDGFHVGGLSPGRYVVAAQGAGAAAAAWVEIKPAATAAVTLTAPPPATLEGQVTEAGSGTPLEGVPCAVVPELVASDEVYFPAWVGGEARAVSDARGGFVMGSVPSGQVALVCLPNFATHQQGQVALSLAPGQRQTAAIALKRRE